MIDKMVSLLDVFLELAHSSVALRILSGHIANEFGRR